MKIDLQNIKVSDLVAGYKDKGEEGVRGYAGRLDIRPAYQREFIYGEKERNAVIDTSSPTFRPGAGVRIGCGPRPPVRGAKAAPPRRPR